MRDALEQLAKRAEQTSGPDRELDAAIWLAVTPGATRTSSTVKSSKGLWPDYVIDETRDTTGLLIVVPAYSASLDAVMTLVPEGCAWSLQGNTSRFYAVCIGHYSKMAATPALALTAAALRARAVLAHV